MLSGQRIRLALALALAGAAACSDKADRERNPVTTSSRTDQSARVAVGAIRWDAWHGDKGVPGKAVEKSLGPAHWHYRLPFYAKVVGPDRVEVRGDSQGVMDREIEAAAAGGLDYWAFGYYHPLGSPMFSCLPLYLKSRLKTRLNFCLWLEDLGPVGDWSETAKIIAGLLQEPTHQTVAGGRPLVYVHCQFADKFGSAEAARKALGTLHEAVAKAGLPRPYLVLMHPGARQNRELLAAGEFDAVGAYALVPKGEGRQPYAALAADAERQWDEWAKGGRKAVPLAMAGWDRRPRQENPVPWESGDWTRSTLHFDPPKPEELAAHVRKAVEWTKAHLDSAEARAVLIYAWNETDEGGWLVPTLQEDAARLEAIGRALGRKEG
jgi:hypothetical protein